MNNNIAYRLWFFAAICFVIAGIIDKNIRFIILGCIYMYFGFSKKKKSTDKDGAEK